MVRQRGSRQRVTLCVSSQVGCAMNCQFCFTGERVLLLELLLLLVLPVQRWVALVSRRVLCC